MPGFASLAMVNLDCTDPPVLARFYSEVLGWPVTHSQDEYAMISDGATSIGFGQVPGYRPTIWPQEPAPKRYHLDFYVDDLDKAEALCLELGATKPQAQPEPKRWRVMIDPSGQPFDLCARPEQG
jgi:predicted enzyme related to lactoylglutathione lyase